ncbi:MAG: septum formation inhibitor Maf [Acidobacteria bacterium]|nr:MAG: septum formation inhibitor Maf [Acidobacteriota bacterium]
MPPKPNLVLASASPRRQELLRLLQVEFEVLPSQIRETTKKNETPPELVQRLAQAKALWAQRMRPKSIIVGADTVVVCDDQILGKPHSALAARRMLNMLSGRNHEVLTGVCTLYEQHCEVDVSRTVVQFSPLSSREIKAYLNTAEPFDKAGAYAIQGFGSRFIERVDGCYFNVVGLPLSLLYQMLKKMGFPFNG